MQELPISTLYFALSTGLFPLADQRRFQHGDKPVSRQRSVLFPRFSLSPTESECNSVSGNPDYCFGTGCASAAPSRRRTASITVAGRRNVTGSFSTFTPTQLATLNSRAVKRCRAAFQGRGGLPSPPLRSPRSAAWKPRILRGQARAALEARPTRTGPDSVSIGLIYQSATKKGAFQIRCVSIVNSTHDPCFPRCPS